MLVIKQFGPVTYAMGTLQEILAGTGIAAKVRALPNDVAGCTLEMGADGKWVGTLGSLSEATADALYASGALVNLATGATYRDTSGVSYSYGGAVAGWETMETPRGVASFGMSNYKTAQKARIFFVGDSNGAGQGTANRLQSFPSLMAVRMGWRDGAWFGTGGMGTAWDPRTAMGSFASSGRDSPGSLALCAGASSTDLVFSPGIFLDSFDIWYPKTANGNTSVSVKVDGVVVDTFSQTGANAYLKRSYMVPWGVHTIGFSSAGTGTAYISGIETHDSTSLSHEMVNCCVSASKMSDLNSNTNPWQTMKAMQLLAPTAIVLHCTINDLDNSVTPVTLRGLIDTWVNSINSYGGIDQALTVSWAWSNSALSTDGTLDGVSNYLKETASAFGGAWADARYAVGASGVQSSALGYVHDAWHLNALGYSKYPQLFCRMFH